MCQYVPNAYEVQIESTKRDMSIDSKDVFLAQGTLRPDLIESASKEISSHADTIKAWVPILS